MWSAVMLAPSSVRSRFSSSIFRLYGSASAPSTAESRNTSWLAPPTVQRPPWRRSCRLLAARASLLTTGSLVADPRFILTSRYLHTRRAVSAPAMRARSGSGGGSGRNRHRPRRAVGRRAGRAGRAPRGHRLRACARLRDRLRRGTIEPRCRPRARTSRPIITRDSAPATSAMTGQMPSRALREQDAPTRSSRPARRGRGRRAAASHRAQGWAASRRWARLRRWSARLARVRSCAARAGTPCRPATGPACRTHRAGPTGPASWGQPLGRRGEQGHALDVVGHREQRRRPAARVSR